jgi:hypothetical protein
MAKYGNRSGRLLRRVTGIVVSYAVALQSLFIGFAGSPQPASADQALPAFELCLNVVKRHGPPSQPWRTFLRNHAPDIAAMDLFVAPTIGFNLLYGFITLPRPGSGTSPAPRGRLNDI